MSVVPVSIAAYDDSPEGSVIEFRTLASLLALSAAAHHHDDNGGVADNYSAPGTSGRI
jgi:hypothetical protein